ncbi:hypothetical protein Acr_26g0004250 [Actinidia rufa]|uniref:Uncharacterized protein n=1 Tax=Actinidia rufa TaxID=165716 RepID=A0A7J0H2B6_9ERIC|nr:hypothetical protein Acr_26g0004250 [Actinidia rufa]
MSLNCLNCQGMRRIDSDKELIEKRGGVDKPCFVLGLSKVDRSRSGNLVPRPYEKIRNELKEKLVRAGHHRLHSISGLSGYEDGSRLVRSCGIRRDWSFEDLRKNERIKR